MCRKGMGEFMAGDVPGLLRGIGHRFKQPFAQPGLRRGQEVRGFHTHGHPTWPRQHPTTRNPKGPFSSSPPKRFGETHENPEAPRNSVCNEAEDVCEDMDLTINRGPEVPLILEEACGLLHGYDDALAEESMTLREEDRDTR